MIGYQYTLIKYIHNDVSGECVNVGLVLLAPDHRTLKVQFNPRCGRTNRFFRNAFDRNHWTLSEIRNLPQKTRGNRRGNLISDKV
jgi:hypothetical protein